jgi:uncharacterized protein YjbI with pentapeptide repeats
MAEGKDTRTVEQETEPTKHPPWWKRLWGWTEFGEKTGWQWLELLSALAIPVVLAIAGYWFTMQQDARQQAIETQRANQAQKIENQRAEAERELAEQRAQDAALQAYLDQMSTLLIQHDLRTSEEDSEVRTLARARTATVIQRLDADGNRNVIRFLNEARLVGDGQSSMSLLAEADLPGARLEGADLSSTDLRGADLSDAFLYRADLRGADLRGAELFGADLSGADLRNTHLGGDLSNTDLSNTDLRGADLSGADLSYVYLPSAFLSDAELFGADLRGADLSDAFLYRADLRGADLTDANLTDAYLDNASGVTEAQLEEQAQYLKGATMPDGSIHP